MDKKNHKTNNRNTLTLSIKKATQSIKKQRTPINTKTTYK